MPHPPVSSGAGTRERVARPPGYEAKLIIALFITWGLVFLDRMAPLFLGPFLAKDLHLNPGQIGAISAALSLAWGLSAFFFGMVSDRFGRRVVLLPSVFLLSVLSWVTGVVGTFAQMVVVRAGMGVCEGPAANLLVAIPSEEAPPEHRGRDVGFVQSAAGLVGLAVAPVLVTQIAAHMGWRPAFYIIAIPGIIMGLILTFFLREPAKFESAERQRPDYREVFRHRNMWLAMLGTVGFTTWLLVLDTFAPLYLTQVDGMAPTTMGFVMTFIGLSGFLWGFGVPWISDRIGRKVALFVFAIASLLVPLSMLVVHSPTPLSILGLVLAAGQGLAPLLMVVVPSETVAPTVVGAAVGITLLCGELFGSTGLTYLAGILANHYGLAVTMWVATGGAALVALATVFMKETLPAKHSEKGVASR
jgi:predicted MFS family arabinose efflux permease